MHITIIMMLSDTIVTQYADKALQADSTSLVDMPVIVGLS